MPISVVICTHNCPPPRLDKVVRLVLAQEGATFEVLVVDNASTMPVIETLHLTDDRVRVCQESTPGLTHARLRGMAEAQHDVIAFVDDDNYLQPGFIAKAEAAMAASPRLGVLGGRSRPLFEADRPPYLVEMQWAPGCLDAGDRVQSANWRDVPESERTYPSFSPIGTGMIVRKSVLLAYSEELRSDPRRAALDRRGQSLASAGDNDIVLTALKGGYDVCYDPALESLHDIPAGRISAHYVERYLYETNITWVQVLDFHGISPWRPIPRWSLPLRRLRAWWRLRAWRNEKARLAWVSACGQLEGRARIGHRDVVDQIPVGTRS